MLDFQIVTFSHFFKVDVLTPHGVKIMMEFARAYARFEWTVGGYNKPKTLEVKMTYAWRTADFTEFRFHIGQLPSLKEFLYKRNYPDEGWRITSAPMYPTKDFDLVLRPGLVLKDYQDEAVNFTLEPDTECHQIRDVAIPKGCNTRLIGLRTGAGKTITSLAIAAKLGKRILVEVLPKYMDKWASDISENLNIKPKEIMLINGRNALIGAAMACRSGELDHIKAFVISLPTIRNFIVEFGDDPFKITGGGVYTSPEEVFADLQCGYAILDEAHESFDYVYYSMLFLHIPLLVCLSATVLTENDLIRKMHNLVFPYEKRFNKIVAAAFAMLLETQYYIRHFDPKRFRYTQNGMYSHAVFEQSMLKNKALLASYMEFIYESLYDDFMREYKPGDKALVYVARIEFGTVLTAFLKKKFPNLDVRRVMENDPYENVIVPDIRIGSNQRLGTAVDIPKLTTVLDTQAMSSTVSNIQKFGRLRFIPDRLLVYRYLTCLNIPKHIEYSTKRQLVLQDRYKGVKTYQAHRMV